jgi:hypothetical protein
MSNVIRQNKQYIKQMLDLMHIPSWQENLPAGYKCNSKTWKTREELLPRVFITGEHYDTKSPAFNNSFINIEEGLPDGFHPVYEFPSEIQKNVDREVAQKQEEDTRDRLVEVFSKEWRSWQYE